MQELTADQVMDASGLACPLPLLKAKVALNGMGGGQVLLVIATDPGSWRDIPSFARLSGHALLHQEAADGRFRYWLRKD